MPEILPLYISSATKQLRKKANANSGDPFSAYRTQGQLPDVFEYGMNCFFDRVFESYGTEVTQKAYQILRESGGKHKWFFEYSTNNYDITGIPVLFGVTERSGFDVVNEAVDILNSQRAQTRTKRIQTIRDDLRGKIFGDKRFILTRHEGESDHNYTIRTMCLSDAYANASMKHKGSVSEIFEACSVLIMEPLEKDGIISSTRQISRDEIGWIEFSAGLIARDIVSSSLDDIRHLLIQTDIVFFVTLWRGIWDEFQKNCTNIPKCLEVCELLAESVKEEQKNLLDTSNYGPVWQTITGIYAQSGPLTDTSLILCAITFLQVYGVDVTKQDNLPSVENSLLPFLLNAFYRETVKRRKL